MCEEKIEGGAKPTPRIAPKGMFQFPTVDPAGTDPDSWFPASRFERLAELQPLLGNPDDIGEALAQAVSVTQEAIKTSALGDTPSKAKAAGLQVVAAELRRVAGAWGACTENFAAVALHLVETEDLISAEAYLQKLLFVVRHADNDAIKADAYVTAAATALALEKLSAADVYALHAAKLAGPCPEGDLGTRLDAVFRGIEAKRIATVRKKGSPRVSKGIRKVVAPDEFRFRAVVTEETAASLVSSPWRSKAGTGIALLMRHPGPAGECRSWVSHRVVHGKHEIVALPNWSGRAMGSAKAMLALSETASFEADAASAAVLQVCCALEAFINAAVHFIREAEDGAWRHLDLPDFCGRSNEAINLKTPTFEMWQRLSGALFTAPWIGDAPMTDFNLLVELRNYLVHYKGDHAEAIDVGGSTHRMAKEFKLRKCLRSEPGPWIDMVLTRELAAWAIETGEAMIRGFRNAWIAEGVKYDAVIGPEDIAADLQAAADGSWGEVPEPQYIARMHRRLRPVNADIGSRPGGGRKPIRPGMRS